MFRRIFWILNLIRSIWLGRGDSSFFSQNIYAGGQPRPRKQVWVSYLLLFVNVLILIAMSFAGGSSNSEVLIDFGAMYGPYLAAGQYWRLFTAMFIHVGIIHLLFNSFGLWIFGRMAEALFGSSKFVLIYVLAGLCGAVVSYIFNPIVIAAGASGAIFGILGALAAFFSTMYKDPNARKNLYGLLGLVGLNLILGFLSSSRARWAHMGGFASGFILGYFITPVSGYVHPVSGILLHPGYQGFYVINKLKKTIGRYIAILIVLLIIVGGIWLGNTTLPTNTATEVIRAQKLIEEKDYVAALTNIERAISVGSPGDVFLGRAYFLRALIMTEYGDIDSALNDIRYALLHSDEKTRKESIQLLTKMKDLR